MFSEDVKVCGKESWAQRILVGWARGGHSKRDLPREETLGGACQGPLKRGSSHLHFLPHSEEGWEGQRNKELLRSLAARALNYTGKKLGAMGKSSPWYQTLVQPPMCLLVQAGLSGAR